MVSGSTTTSYAYNAADELCATSTSGAASCTSPTYTWDYNAKNQTVSRTFGGNTQTLTYADADQTERVTEGNVTEAWSPLGLAEETDSYGSTYFTRDPQGNPIGQNHASGDFYFLTDALGSIDIVFNNTGAVTRSYTYDPFGNLTDNGGTTGSDLKYTGAYWDSQTGNPGSPPLYHIGTRYYDPTTGRWTQQDPIGGEIMNPATVNAYTYAADDPINEIDPSGMLGCSSGCARGSRWARA